LDAKFVMTGSDDTNIRLWKSHASDPLGILLPRQKQSIEYAKSLKERYKYLPEIRRIDRHRQLPKPIFKAKRMKQVIKDSANRKLENRRKHSKPGAIVQKSEREKHVVQQME